MDFSSEAIKYFGGFGLILIALTTAFIFAAKLIIKNYDLQIEYLKVRNNTLSEEAKSERADNTRILESLKSIIQEKVRVDIERGVILEKNTTTLAMVVAAQAEIRNSVNQLIMFLWSGDDRKRMLEHPLPELKIPREEGAPGDQS